MAPKRPALLLVGMGSGCCVDHTSRARGPKVAVLWGERLGVGAAVALDQDLSPLAPSCMTSWSCKINQQQATLRT
jgi:hypothetical protein